MFKDLSTFIVHSTIGAELRKLQNQAFLFTQEGNPYKIP